MHRSLLHAPKIRERAEIALNVLVLIFSLFLAVTVLYRYIEKPKAETVKSLRGAHLAIPSLEWHDRQKSLVLALNTNCHFCTASAPFYVRLVQQAKAHGIRTIAVLPQSIEESHTYLQKLNVRTDKVISAPLSSIHVFATPTLLLVSSTGEVIDSWTGQLRQNLENGVSERLQ